MASAAVGVIALSPVAAETKAPGGGVLGTANGLTYVFEQKLITDADPVLVRDCPGDTAVTGGGTFIDTEDAGSAAITNSTPQPAGDPKVEPDEGWLSEGKTSVPAGSPMVSYAICSDRPAKLRYASKAVFVPANGIKSTGVKCPSGTAVTGGGALTDSDLGDMILFGSTPFPGGDPKGWSATAQNNDAAQHSLVAYAICSKEKTKYSHKRKTVQVPDGTPGSAHKVVDCPKGSAVSGGGADVFGAIDADARLTVSSPQPAGDPNKTPKKGWIAEAAMNGGGELKVWAICKK